MSAINQVSDTVLLIDGATIIYANDGASKKLGYTNEELVGKSIQEIDYLLTPELARHIAEMVDSVGHYEFETVHTAKDGTEIEVSVTSVKCAYDDKCLSMTYSRDITEQKKALKLLQDNEKLFGSLIQNIPGFAYVFRMKLDGSLWLEFVSGGIKSTLGIGQESVLGGFEAFQNLMYPDEREKIVEIIKKSAITLTPFRMEFRIEHPRKSEVWIEANALPERESDGSVVWYGIMRDVTRRKVAEDELVDSSSKLKEIFDNSTDILYLLSVEGEEFKMLDINPAFESGLGLGRDIIGSFIGENLSEEAGMALKEKYLRCLRNNAPVDEIIELEVPAGKKIFQSNIIPVRDEKGTIYRLLGICRDITAQKTVEKILHKRNQEFRALVENSPDAIIRYDINCNRIYVNATTERITGKSSEELLSGTPKSVQLVDKNDSDRIVNAIKAVIKTKQPVEIEVKHVGIDGRVHYYGNRYAPEYDAEHQISSVISVSRDITERKVAEEILTKKETEFRTLVENSPDIIVRYNKECRRLYVNNAYEKISGIDPDELFWRKPTEISILDEETARLLESTIEVVFATAQDEELEISFLNKDNVREHHQMRLTPEFDANGMIDSVLSVSRDVTSLKDVHTKLEKSENSLKEAQRLAKIGNWELKFPNYELYWSDEIYRIFEIEQYEFNASYEAFLNLIHPDDRELVDMAYTESLKTKTPYDIVHRLLMPDGRIKYVHEHCETYYGFDDEPLVSMGTIQDVTQYKMAEKKIEFMAYHDALTGLPNRVLARDRVEQSIAHSQRYNLKTALLFLDLDNFKTINDSLGHLVGDEILKAVASRLKASVREVDTVSRLGGDEFIVLLTDIKNVSAVVKAVETMLEELEQPFYSNGYALSTSMSIGVAMYPDDGTDFDILLQRADTAMYKAKESGKNTYSFYNGKMNQDSLENLHLQNDLKLSLKENRFELYYQPQIDIASGHAIGTEALIRWNHPEHGMISPVKFIPLAEATGVIIQIGEWVLKEACNQAAKWHGEGRNIVMAVNISAVQFRRGNIEKTVAKALEESGLDPKFLELELTESILISDESSTIKTLQRLKNLGIQLSIDDFGTGYSSLSYLRKFRIDKLKIDQSFVRDIVDDVEDRAIVTAIVQMAKSLNLKTIAEGVEDEVVLQYLSQMGCDEIQGYYISKPLPPREIEYLL